MHDHSCVAQKTILHKPPYHLYCREVKLLLVNKSIRYEDIHSYTIAISEDIKYKIYRLSMIHKASGFNSYSTVFRRETSFFLSFFPPWWLLAILPTWHHWCNVVPEHWLGVNLSLKPTLTYILLEEIVVCPTQMIHTDHMSTGQFMLVLWLCGYWGKGSFHWEFSDI